MIKNIASYGALLLLIQGLVACDKPRSQNEYRSAPSASDDVANGCVSQSTKPAVKGTKKARQIIAFGDSLYAGYRLGPCDGFAPQLQAALQAKGAAANVLNAGVSGDTTAAGRARLAFVLDNAPQKPDMVIVGLGGNDMLRGIKPEETRANLTAMLDELKKRKIDVVLTGMLASPNMGPDYAAKFNPIYPDLAKQYNIPLYPFFLDGVVTDAKQMLDDGIHPNKQGISRIVSGIEPVIETALNANNNNK